MTDLDAALAAEEHRQGMRYGEDPSHCGDCRDADRRRLEAEVRATCTHERVATMPTLDTLAVPGVCEDCGRGFDDVRVEGP